MTEWTVNNKLNAWYQKRYHIKLPKEFVTKSEIYFGGSSFSPSALFALAEPGVWFDPSDLTTLFQDPAGTTPVTAPGNTVGLMLDKSKGLALGAELITNPEFNSGSTGWLGLALSVIGGQASATNSSGTAAYIYQNVGAAAGKYYELTINIISVSGVAKLILNGGAGAASNALSTGVTTVRLQNNSANGNAGVELANAASITIESLTIREVAGNHATQATIAARPTYSIEPVGGRRNLLTYSEQFEVTTGGWNKVNCSITETNAVDPLGGNTARRFVAAGTSGWYIQSFVTTLSALAPCTFSIWVKRAGSVNQTFNLFLSGANQIGPAVTATDTWQRVSYSVTVTQLAQTAGIWPNGAAADILIWGAQLELGSVATPYQRVTTQHDVTEAGVASMSYLYFDGSDDHMVTSTITPATDKAQVFTGVKKLSDANPRGLLDYGPSWTTYTGSFAIYAPSYLTGGLPAPKYSVAMKGAAGQRETEYATYAAPITNVLSTLFDISEPAASEILMRIDGVVIAPAASGGSAITGNFNNLALQIGRIGTGSSVNVNLYSLITRFGPTLDAPTITSTEIWVGDKTGIDIAKITSTTIYTRSGDTILDRANSTIERRAV